MNKQVQAQEEGGGTAADRIEERAERIKQATSSAVTNTKEAVERAADHVEDSLHRATDKAAGAATHATEKAAQYRQRGREAAEPGTDHQGQGRVIARLRLHQHGRSLRPGAEGVNDD